MEITKLGLDNIDEMLKIEKKAFARHWNKQIFTDELSAENGHYIAISSGGKLLGYSGFRHVLDEAHITTLAVDRKLRKKGIGTRLIKQLLEDAAGMKITQLYLEVRQSNLAALALYQKLGFKVIDRRREYYQHPVEDALVMAYEAV